MFKQMKKKNFSFMLILFGFGFVLLIFNCILIHLLHIYRGHNKHKSKTPLPLSKRDVLKLNNSKHIGYSLAEYKSTIYRLSLSRDCRIVR